MAYAALVSLEHTIDYLVNSSDLWVVPRYDAITECKQQVKSLEKVLQGLDGSIKRRSRKKTNSLDEQIEESASRFEDVLEIYLSDQIVKQNEENEARIRLEHENRIRFFKDMESLKQNVHSFSERIKMETKELKKLLPEEDLKNLAQSASRFEDVLDVDLSNSIVSVKQFNGRGRKVRVLVDMQYLRRDIKGFTTRMKKMENEYIKELENRNEEDGEEEAEDSASSKVLYLPQHLKACFLHMGLFFHENYKIPRSKLISMWDADGFLEQNKMPIAQWGVECIEGLLASNVAILHQHSSVELSRGEQIKTCGLRASFWHLCNSEASKSNFFYALNKLEDCTKDGIKGQRRLCFRNNVLFGISLHDSLVGDRAPSVRSLLCYGPYHQYQVPVWLGLRLLRVVDALNVRFYEFPIQATKLVLLKYFALTFNGDLPTSISQLRKLQYFIVRRHMSIKSGKDPSYLPREIWDMEELKHLEVMGSDLRVPSRGGILLPNLQTLLSVSGRSCSKEILGRMQNLKKIGVRIELGFDENEPLRLFDHISHLRGLGSLKCVIVNPDFNVIAPSPPFSVFPLGLKKLTLSGFGYSWGDMGAIGSIRNLEVLKLQCYAFRGPKWEIKARQFMKLSSLMIEDTDLAQWHLRLDCLPVLVNLSVKRCYKLKEIHWEHDRYFRPKIAIQDCNPLGVACVKQIVEAISGNAHSVPHLHVHSSYMD